MVVELTTGGLEDEVVEDEEEVEEMDEVELMDDEVEMEDDEEVEEMIELVELIELVLETTGSSAESLMKALWTGGDDGMQRQTYWWNCSKTWW